MVLGGGVCETTRPTIVLVGFAGSGKTVVGEELAQQIDKSWVDLDREIEIVKGKSVSEIIRVEGIEAFRKLERSSLEEVLRRQVSVISIGGGTLTVEGVQELLNNSNTKVVLLIADTQTIAKRVLRDEQRRKEKLDADSFYRPVIFDGLDVHNSEALGAKIEKLAQERSKTYQRHDLCIHTDIASVSQIARDIEGEMEFLKSSKKRYIVLPAKSENSKVVAGTGILETLGRRIAARYPALERCILLTDNDVASSWMQSVAKVLQGEKFIVHPVMIASGEESKSLKVFGEVADKLLTANVTRNDVLVALGGGVVGDLGGFIASTYMRGIGLVHVPTSLVAQVDSAIGGKTAVNLQGGKNILGTFREAELVLCDTDFLSTLSDRQFCSGLAEVTKYGATLNGGFYHWLESNVSSVLNREPGALLHIVTESIKSKQRIVARDMRDTEGVRAVLNFGHTIGHAIEQLTEYKELLHGEAVAIGMSFALELGEKKGFTEHGLHERVKKLLKNFNLPVNLPEGCLLATEEAWKGALRADKKRVSENIDFIVVEKLGVSRVVKIPVEEIIQLVLAQKKNRK